MRSYHGFIYDELYQVNVLVFLNIPLAQASRIAAREYNLQFNVNDNPAGFVSMDTQRDIRYILYVDRINDNGQFFSTLTHEVFHLTYTILKQKGLTLTDESEEAYAYYQDYWFRQCYDRLKDKKHVKSEDVC